MRDWRVWSAGLLLVLGLPAYAAEPELRVALFDVLPYAGQAPEGSPRGIYVDLARAIALRARLPLKIDLYPFARVGALVESGQADATLSFTTEPLERGAWQVGVVATVDSVVVLRKGLSAATSGDLAGLMIGRLKGGCLDLAKTPAAVDRLYDVNTFDSGVRMLMIGRLDGLCTTREAFVAAARRAGGKATDFGLSVFLSQREVQFHLTKKASPALRERLQVSLDSLRKDHTLEKIWQSYLEVPHEK